MTNPDADVRLPDVYDFEGVPRWPRRHCDTVAIPAMEIGLTGIAQLRRALGAGEAGIREYLARTAGQDAAPEPGAPLSEACAWHGGEGAGRLSCPECHAEEQRHHAEVERHHADEGGPMFDDRAEYLERAIKDGLIGPGGFVVAATTAGKVLGVVMGALALHEGNRLREATADPELAAMAGIVALMEAGTLDGHAVIRALYPLDGRALVRVLRWLLARFPADED